MMTEPPRRPRAILSSACFGLMLVLGFASACSKGSQAPAGGSQAAASVGDGSEPMGAGCTQGPPVTLGPNDMTPFGVTPADLLANVSGTHIATLTWGTPPAETGIVVHPSGTTRLTIDVTPANDGIVFYPELGQLCGSGVLTISAGVQFVTDDGGFNEMWQLSLTSFDGESIGFTRDLHRTPPSGTVTITDPAAQMWNSTETQLTATFDGRGFRGEVDYNTEQMFSTGPNSGGGGGLHIVVASWVPQVGDDAGGDAAIGDALGE